MAVTEHRREYLRQYQRQRRQEWRVWVLAHLGGKCVVCGTIDQLEVHHKEPERKSFNIAQIWSHNMEKQLMELKKCELRCSDHHKEFHAWGHGTDSGYKSGCRCDLCLEAKRLYNREYMVRWRTDGRDKSRKSFKGPLAQ